MEHVFFLVVSGCGRKPAAHYRIGRCGEGYAVLNGQSELQIALRDRKTIIVAFNSPTNACFFLQKSLLENASLVDLVDDQASLQAELSNVRSPPSALAVNIAFVVHDLSCCVLRA